jgi:hypothetical protein
VTDARRMKLNEVTDKLVDKLLLFEKAASVSSLDALVLDQSKKPLQIAECHFEAATVLESVETATVELVRRCVTTWHIC